MTTYRTPTEKRIADYLTKRTGGAGADPVGAIIKHHDELYQRALAADADKKVVQFPSGRQGSRNAQVVYDEMRALAAELQELTGEPVSFTAHSTAKGGFSPPLSPKGAA